MFARGAHFGSNRTAAWWRIVAKRPAVLWTVLAVDLFLMLEGLSVVAYLNVAEPDAVNVGRVPGIAVSAQPPSGPQPAPVRIAIPKIGVKSELTKLDVDAAGELEVPKKHSVAGWWASGPAAGADGAAVIVGHVDSQRGAAVFYRLNTLQPGDPVAVNRADGSTVTFVVDAIRQYAKDDLPTRLVYGPTTRPELRLITCGGRFDKRAGSYQDNVVVFAHELSRTAALTTA